MALTYEEAWNAKPDGRSQEEIFQSIVNRVKERANKANKPMSDTEAKEATRNLIALGCEMMGVDYTFHINHSFCY